MVKLSSPVIRVVIEKNDDLVEYTVRADNRDFCQWDITRARNSWPDMQAANFLWMTFMAFSALSREGIVTGPFQEFQKKCIEVHPVNDNPEDSLVNSTPPVQDIA